jgi:hypothetical protein
MQKQNPIEVLYNDSKAKMTLIKQLCSTIGDAFNRIEDICTEQIEEVTEPSPFG